MNSKLERITERVWIFPYEEWRDRPNLGYIRGDKFSVAVDAGHSASHVEEFYDLLKKEGLPLPELTVITHWHWDHTFGMHATNGLCAANSRTNAYLEDCRRKIAENGPEEFLSMYDSIRNEYQNNAPVIVTLADIVYDGNMEIDLGGCTVKLIRTEAPHTDDSTLVYVEEEKVLFIGDSACGSFPGGGKDMNLARKLADSIESLDVDICIEGHWGKLTKAEELNDLANGDT